MAVRGLRREPLHLPGSRHDRDSEPELRGAINDISLAKSLRCRTNIPGVYYNDNASTITRWIDGGLVPIGDGLIAAPNTTIALAVGGSWCDNLSNPSAYVCNVDIYSIKYYGP
jgi:hypothetical protein